ncbi:hypothetical protein RP20_CCG026700 [Aedes albopictus]|nr:uncharacterized protein LOC109401522 [Aedes albopictus]XP_019531189.2 uncharacterized protein LOC109402903 [Aedes albopictus]KXJ69524.1 hypothetical protein RP20_CCG026700 [Aedes albopictus]
MFALAVTLVSATALLTIANAEGGMNININQPNAQVYHQQSSRNDQFTYGYHVDTVSNQFQHKVKGPDDVTYGCYGYVDPANKKHLVYYVADRMGYRIIFPNRPTKIFTERISDSLNKLDGSVKSKDYDEKVVAWNDLYLPDACFRLEEILSSAASNVHQQTVRPLKVATTTPRVEPIYVQPELPTPTQYTVPTTPATSYVHLNQHGDRYTRPTYQGGDYSTGQDSYQQGKLESNVEQVQQTATQWSGSLPDINPANINLDQFNIHATSEDSTSSASSTNFNTQQYHSLNITQLLAQIEAVNSQVITLNMLLAGMANNPNGFSTANEGSCKTVVQLLRNQRTTPQLVYVPILIPYVEGQYNVNQPFGNTAVRYQQQKPCHRCQ